jgi:hypothetical protein
MIRTTKYFFGVILITILSCCHKTYDRKAYFSYLNDPDNGYVMEKRIGDKKLTVKYLPLEYFVFKNNAVNKDSIKKLYGESRSFLVTIQNTDTASGAIIHSDVKDYSEYKDLTFQLNFDVKEFFRLKTDNAEYKPVLGTTENTYGLQKSVNIILVFAPKDANSKDLFESDQYDFIFHDELFKTGTSHFVFRKKNIDREINLKING